MTNILVLDTATENCSVAVKNGTDIVTLSEVCPREHSQKLLPMVDQVLSDAGVSLKQLDAIGFGQGPGSFTGVRISISMMQGLAFGADLPVIGVSTLAAMAQQAFRLHQATHIVSAIDARMGEIYLGCYQIEQGIAQLAGNEVVVNPEGALSELEAGSNWHGVGTGWQTYAEVLSPQAEVTVLNELLYPQAIDMLAIAENKFEQGQLMAVEQAEPVYLRDKVTWKKLPGRE